LASEHRLDSRGSSSYSRFSFGDVAELADAQVSEACDGDIVEVQVLSSPPKYLRASLSARPFLRRNKKRTRSFSYSGARTSCPPAEQPARISRKNRLGKPARLRAAGQ